MTTLLQDLRYGLRMLAKNPGFTVVAVLTLALGTGANTAIYTLINAALFKPLPFPDADRLAFLWQENLRTGKSEGAVSYPNYADWRAQSHSFQDMAFIMFAQEFLNETGTKEILSGSKGPERVTGARVSTNFFSVMGVNPTLGRGFVPDDATKGNTDVVVISYGLWQSRFGGDAQVLGRRLGFGDSGDTIIGVMPSGFSFPEGTELWKPRQIGSWLQTKARQYPNMGVIGRLRPGKSWSQAQAEMDAIAERLAAEYPASNGGVGVRIVPLREQLSQKVRRGLLVLWGAIFGVLLIACANTANLMMARAAGRQKEIAVRFSLGASRWLIVRQFLAESLLLAIAGAAAGCLLADWIVSFVSKANRDVARLGGTLLDLRVLSYTLAVSAFAALVCGVLPAFSAFRQDLNRTLKEIGSGAECPGAQKTRRTLILAEVSLAFVLLTGSGLLIRSLQRIFSVNPGFDAGHVLTLRLYWPPLPSNTPAGRTDAAYRRIMARFGELPGVTAVGSTSNVLFPGEMYSYTPFVVEGEPSVTDAQRPFLTAGDASPELFRAMGIPLIRGRIFADSDAAENAPSVIIINETMARRYWPNEDPIGKRLKLVDPNLKEPWLTVVGVVGDVRQQGLENPSGNMIYFPSSGYFADDLVIRTAGDPRALMAAVREQVHAEDKSVVVGDMEIASEKLSRHEAPRRFNAYLLAAFASVALLLAAVGIYGTISFWVKHRTREFGIRMALGAQRTAVLKLVVGQGFKLTLIGVAIGIAGALALTRFLSSLLYGVKSTDPLTFILVSLLLSAVALLASYLPARRATKVDPMVALRYE